MNKATKQRIWVVLGLIAMVVPVWLVVQLKLFHNQRLRDRLSRMAVTPLDHLQAVAGTGKMVHIEANALGDPPLQSLAGEPLAFQKLTVRGIGRTTYSCVKYFPKYFCVDDGKGSLWIDFSQFVERTRYANKDSRRTSVANELSADFDKFAKWGRVSLLSTIKRGEHISAMGKVSKYEKVEASDPPTHYVLHTPDNALPGEKFLIAE